jgi:hypothetical protein
MKISANLWIDFMTSALLNRPITGLDRGVLK